MSHENVEIARQAARAVEFVSGLRRDRAAGKGLEALRQLWGDHLRNWDRWRTGEIQEKRDLGETSLRSVPFTVEEGRAEPKS